MLVKLVTGASRVAATIGSKVLSPQWLTPILIAIVWRPALVEGIYNYVAKVLPVISQHGLGTSILSVKGTAIALVVLNAVRQASRISSTMAANSWSLKPCEGRTWSEEIAVVTGGYSGVGEAIALRLAALGVGVTSP